MFLIIRKGFWGPEEPVTVMVKKLSEDFEERVREGYIEVVDMESRMYYKDGAWHDVPVVG